MIRAAVKGAVAVVVIAVCGYVACAIPIGRRTLLEHARRIAATDEAQELTKELATASDRAAGEIEARAREAAQRALHGPPVPDTGGPAIEATR